MTAIGFVLLTFGFLATLVLDVERYSWDWRDLFATIPINIGLILILAGVARWLWLVMP